MPTLTKCSQREWDSVLPGIQRPPSSSEEIEDVDMRPFKVYEQAIRKRVDQGWIPGYCSIVFFRNRALHVDSYGYADMERGLPFRTDTPVRVYCMTKSITAAAIMVLVERGLCKLEDEVGKYLPCFSNPKIVAKKTNWEPSPRDFDSPEKITLRRLLTHSCGLGYGIDFNQEPDGADQKAYHKLVHDVEDRRIRSLAEWTEELARLPLRKSPGKSYDYSYGLDVAGRVIEVISGKRLDRFLHETFFKPLGMKDTGFYVPHSQLSRFSALYGSTKSAKLMGELPKGARIRSKKQLLRIDGRTPKESAWAQGRQCPVLSGGGLMGNNSGGLVSTMNDQARFYLMISNGGAMPGGRRILKESTVREMADYDWLMLPKCVGKRQKNDGKPFGWNALGELGVTADKSKLDPDAFEYKEYGMGGAACTFWSVNPEKDLVILWFSQQVDNECWVGPKANLWIAARKAIDKAVEAKKAAKTKKPGAATSAQAGAKGVRKHAVKAAQKTRTAK